MRAASLPQRLCSRVCVRLYRRVGASAACQDNGGDGELTTAAAVYPPAYTLIPPTLHRQSVCLSVGRVSATALSLHSVTNYALSKQLTDS